MAWKKLIYTYIMQEKAIRKRDKELKIKNHWILKAIETIGV